MIEFEAQHFAALKGQYVLVSDDRFQLSLLIEDTETRAGTRPPSPTGLPGEATSEAAPSSPFCVTLSGPADPVLPAQTYQIELPRFGPQHLFISPFKQEGDRIYYELVFN